MSAGWNIFANPEEEEEKHIQKSDKLDPPKMSCCMVHYKENILTFGSGCTVEPLHNGHSGAELSGRCREVAVVGRFQ